MKDLLHIASKLDELGEFHLSDKLFKQVINNVV